MIEALEVTSLRLVNGLTVHDFIDANNDIDAYMRRQPGFQWRRITEYSDGTIIDIVAWDSMVHAESGAAGISGEMAGSPVHATIDHSSVDWRLVDVMHSI